MYAPIVRAVGPTGHGSFVWAIGLTSIIVSSVVLVVRVWSRLLNRSQRFGGDDWMAIAAYPFIVGQGITCMLSVKWGLGMHTIDLTEEQYTKSNQTLLSFIVLYYFNIDFIRISLSLYYRRLFASNKTFMYFVWANIAINVAWHISITLAAVFQCTNPAAMWDKSIHAECLPPTAHQHFCATSSVLLDLIALLLPVPMIWKLHVKTSKKREIYAIFFVGYSVPIMTAGRLIDTLVTGNALNEDPSWNWVNIVLWIPLESTLGYLGIGMPAIIYLVRRWRTVGFKALLSKYTVTQRLVTGTSTGVKSNMDSTFDARYMSRPLSEKKGHVRVESQSVSDDETVKSTMGIVQTRTYTVETSDV